MSRVLSALEIENPVFEAIENSKKLPPPTVLHTLPIFPDRLATNPLQTQALSSIEIAPSSRPKLPPPPSEKESKPPIWDLLEFQIDAEKTIDCLLRSQADEFRDASKRHQTLSLEMEKTRRAVIDQQEAASSWETYRQISSAITSAMTFFAAATVSGAGPATAYLTYALLLSGSSSLLNQVMSLSGGWNWLAGYLTSSEENRTKIASWLEKSVAIGSTLLGLVSLGISATTVQANTPQFWTQKLGSEATNLLSGLSTLVNVATTFLTIKNGVDAANTYNMQKAGKDTEAVSTLYKFQGNEIAKEIRETSDNLQNLQDACSKATQDFLASQRLAAQTA